MYRPWNFPARGPSPPCPHPLNTSLSTGDPGNRGRPINIALRGRRRTVLLSTIVVTTFLYRTPRNYNTNVFFTRIFTRIRLYTCIHVRLCTTRTVSADTRCRKRRGAVEWLAHCRRPSSSARPNKRGRPDALRQTQCTRRVPGAERTRALVIAAGRGRGRIAPRANRSRKNHFRFLYAGGSQTVVHGIF